MWKPHCGSYDCSNIQYSQLLEYIDFLPGPKIVHQPTHSTTIIPSAEPIGVSALCTTKRLSASLINCSQSCISRSRALKSANISISKALLCAVSDYIRSNKQYTYRAIRSLKSGNELGAAMMASLMIIRAPDFNEGIRLRKILMQYASGQS